MKTAVVSVAFRRPYVEHSHRQEKVIKEMNPEVAIITFRDLLPMKDGTHSDNIVEIFQKSLYGFKPHAIQVARGVGFEKIIWFDPSVLPTSSLDILVKALDEHPVIVRTGDAPILKMTNQKAKDWFGFKDEELTEVKHVGGTIYGFNFTDPQAVEVFEMWKRAEEEGIFQDQDAFMAGNWADESAFALTLHKLGVPQVWCSEYSYLNQKEMP